MVEAESLFVERGPRVVLGQLLLRRVEGGQRGAVRLGLESRAGIRGQRSRGVRGIDSLPGRGTGNRRRDRRGLGGLPGWLHRLGTRWRRCARRPEGRCEQENDESRMHDNPPRVSVLRRDSPGSLRVYPVAPYPTARNSASGPNAGILARSSPNEPEACGDRALEPRRLCADRMNELESRRVEADPLERIAAAAEPEVADDRMPELRELDPDLAAASRAKRQLDERRLPAPLEHAIMRDRALAEPGVSGRSHAQAAIAHEPALERPVRLADDAVDQRHVDAPDGLLLELRLQASLRGGRLREGEEAGGLPVEPVDDEETARRALGGDVIEEQPVGRASALGLGPDREQPRRLVDHQQICVLVHEAKRPGELGRRVRRDADAIALGEWEMAAADDAPVDPHPVGAEPLLQRAPGGLRKERVQTVE